MTTYTTIDYEHYEGCPSQILKPDRFEQPHCNCPELFDFENTRLRSAFPKIYSSLKRLRFYKQKLKLKL